MTSIAYLESLRRICETARISFPFNRITVAVVVGPKCRYHLFFFIYRDSFSFN